MDRSFDTMLNLETEVLSYVMRVVEERLANDPIRRNAFHALIRYFATNNCTASQGSAMINSTFGTHNKDLGQLIYTLVQDQYQGILLYSSTLHVRAAKVFKVAMMCLCIQFMDLFVQRFSVNHPLYATLRNAVDMFTVERITEIQLRLQFNHVLDRFPDFRNELQARVIRLTLPLDLGGGAGSSGSGASNNPGGGNPPPPPQV